MTPRLVRLRIAGFKSFAEPVSLDILPGLTGVVGPNGCGKSNVVEALRWAMGETSARSLRGGEMDDVIFAGTTARPSRNLAEVTITLERAGEDGTLPAPYEAEAELQVTRRIERGAGSQFRANGRELRARDVQTLYADLASGARSSGMVSQGRVSQLVNAKPEERRQVLEEAAGITGLHARRHEAELKLRAAEANVTRAEDLRGQLAAAQEGLRKQARQAARYRNISGFIRTAEAEHLAVLFAQAQAALAAAEAGLAAARADAAAAAQEIDISGEALAEAEAALPAVREAEAQARSTLERRRVEAESLAAESARVAREAEEAQARLLELEADCESAARGQADAAASVNRLDGEMRRLEAVLATLPDEVAATRKMLGERRAIAAAAQGAADIAEAAARDALAARHLAQEVFGAAEAREGERRDEHQRALAAQAAARAALVSEGALAAAAAAVREAEAGLGAARLAFEHAEAARAVAERTHLEARGRAGQTRSEAAAARRAHAEILARATAAGEHCAQAEAILARLQASRIAPALLAETASAAEAAQARLHDSETALEAAEAEASAALAARAEAARKRDDLRAAQVRAEAALAQLAARLRAVEGEAERAGSAWAEAARLAPPDADISQAAAALAEAERAFAANQAAMQRLQAGSTQAGLALAAARESASQAEAEAAKYAAEAEGLRAAIGPPGDFATVLDSITVPEGLEAALGAALGDACSAALHDSANTFFRALPQPDDTALPLPTGAQRFDSLMQVPPALSRIMAACVLLPPEADGDALQPALPPGMVAVKPDGACWRWDGHTLRAGAPNAAATKLRQTNRLHAAERALAGASAQAEAARAATEAASRDEATARNFLAAARDTLDQAERALRDARTRSAALASRCAQADAQRATLLPMVERLTAERGSTAQALQEARHALAAMPTPADTEAALSEAARLAGLATQAVESARIARAAARTQLATAQADAGRLRDQARDIEARIEGQTPLLARARADHDSALRQVAGSLEAMAALPDEAALATAETEAEAALRGAAQAQDASRANRKLAEDSLDSARAALSALTLSAAQARSQADAADARCARTAEDLDQAERQLRHAADQRAALPDHTALAQAAEAATAARDATRAAAAEAESRLNRLEPELRQAEVARDLAVHDLAAWQNRLADAASRATLLATRRDAARDAHKALADAPATFAARAEKSAVNLHAAEATHRAANDRLHAAEQRVRGLALARRDAETHAAQKREAVLRSEAAREAAATALAATLARAAERLGETAELPEARDITPDSEERARKKLDRLTREREEMGPVNLRAELELEELDQRLATLEQEREELTTAIAKLRASIGHLNREGRARLEAVFTEVDQHFRTLFTRMMGGGRAHLALTGSDDPLAAGLEIYAEPPGKKLASLSLLSGGEQALTALSLIFAVFRCTPAPISVLDEVDAPLDDANVERFCTLLDDVVRDTGTRFLVVTHHQLTMSRMDRLFGVTMQERGVSRLLSVDLQRAAAMVEPRLQAAE